MSTYPIVNVRFTNEQLDNIDLYEKHLLEFVNGLFDLNALAVTYERVEKIQSFEDGSVLEKICLYDYWTGPHEYVLFA